MSTALAIQKNPRLTTGQRSIYEIVVTKIEKDEKLMFEEAKDVYINKVCRNIINGVPHSWQYIWKPEIKGYTSELLPMDEERLNFVVLHWLTSTLGSLILKGYLTVLPAVDLRLLK